MTAPAYTWAATAGSMPTNVTPAESRSLWTTAGTRTRASQAVTGGCRSA